MDSLSHPPASSSPGPGGPAPAVSPTAAPPPAGAASPASRRRPFKAFGQFIYWVVLMPVRLFKAKKDTPDVIVVYSVHPSFFLWLLIAVGFISAWTVRHYPNSASTAGWVYVWV